MSAPEAVRPHLVSFDTASFVRPVHRFVWRPVPVAPVPAPADGQTAPVSGRRLLVLGEVPRLVTAVAGALRDAGATVDEATAGAEPVPAPWDGIVDLNVTGQPYDLGDGADWRGALARTTRMLQHRYRDWQNETIADRCCYLVVTAMGGLMGYRHCDGGQPLGGIWAGIAKCLPRELPTLAVKAVDIDCVDVPGQLARTVLAEISSWDLFEIGYRRGTRHALTAWRSPAGPARFDLGPGDVVLISGGARGVGFALARALAGQRGCRVVVTGRTPVPVDASAPSQTGDAEYERQRRARLSQARDAAALREIRNQLRREGELRRLAANLAAAARDGLPISYEVCDCTDSEQVRELMRRIPAPTVVVHNAGIDEPKRLDLKTPEEVVRTIEVKVTGFANLTRELLADPARRAALKVFCNVGSLAGRMGGMIGQIDYASGNEALARLGFWARDTHGLPAQTLCWPTWERLGVVTNYDAAVRYVSTIAPEDGVRRWIAEIRSAGTEEAMFIGQIGSALVPTQLRGFWLFTGHPDLPRLHSLAHFLGTVEEFEPFRRLRSTVRYRPGAHPCLADFQVGGAPALPVSVLIEQACAAADWVVPPGWPLQHLTELRQVTAHFDRLRLDQEAGTPFTATAVGSQLPQGWTVDVTVTTAGGGVAGSVTLVYQPAPPPLPGFAAEPPDLQPCPPPENVALQWSGLALGRPRWRRNARGDAQVRLPAVTAADLWTSPFPPAPGIAPAAIEAAVRAARPATRVHIDRIVVSPGAQTVDTLHGTAGNPGNGAGEAWSWSGGRDGQVSLRIKNCTAG